MNDFLLIGDPPIEVYLRNNSLAKRYSLRISNKDNKVSLTLPRWSNLKEAKEFAQSQEEWMRKHLSQQLEPIQINFGKYTLLDGKKFLSDMDLVKLSGFLMMSCLCREEMKNCVES